MPGARLFWVGIALAGLSAAAPAGEEFTKEQLEARFYYDLGPSEIDVSGYPEEQKKNYEIFKQACSQCHTLARPINAPLVSRRQWSRYIRRMHKRTQVRERTLLTKEEGRVIADFLAFDAKVRKVKGKKELEAKTKELKELFERVQQARAKKQIEESREKAKPHPPYTGE